MSSPWAAERIRVKQDAQSFLLLSAERAERRGDHDGAAAMRSRAAQLQIEINALTYYGW